MENEKEKEVVASNVFKIYGKNETEVKALDDVSFSIDRGEFTIILGPSGSGKTTLLNILGGMDNLSSGSIVVNERKLEDMNKKTLCNYRRNDIGFVFQFYNLMPNLTAKENVELATEIKKDALDPLDALKKVGLEDRASFFVTKLSGGEQQRVSIARAIAKNPTLLLCDEPTGALDYVTGKMILKLLFDLSRKENKTVIIVTHNSAIKDMADKVINLKNGKIISIVKNENPVPIEDIEW